MELKTSTTRKSPRQVLPEILNVFFPRGRVRKISKRAEVEGCQEPNSGRSLALAGHFPVPHSR